MKHLHVTFASVPAVPVQNVTFGNHLLQHVALAVLMHHSLLTKLALSAWCRASNRAAHPLPWILSGSRFRAPNARARPCAKLPSLSSSFRHGAARWLRGLVQEGRPSD
jgi:hypothetical protein